MFGKVDVHPNSMMILLNGTKKFCHHLLMPSLLWINGTILFGATIEISKLTGRENGNLELFIFFNLED